MKRLRALAALLSCVAILASGFMTVAAAMPAGASAPERSAIGEQPCSHCDECGGDAKCPMPAATCLQVSSNAAPTLATATYDLPAIEAGTIHWALGTNFLRGLSPPPEPFPPRA
jgi:hypothetical protein